MPDGSVDRGKGNRGRPKRDPIPESALRGFKYFKVLSPILEGLSAEKDHHNRKLFFDQYMVFLLLYFFNPVVTSLRAIQQVSGLKKVQKVLGVRKTSLGSLSEAGNVFDAKLIEPVVQQQDIGSCRRHSASRLAENALGVVA